MGLALLGAGGHASDVLCVVEALAERGVDQGDIFVADDAWVQSDRFGGRMLVKMVESVEAGAILAPFLVAVGYPAPRRTIYDLAESVGGVSAEALVHPDSSVSAGVGLGAGVVVMGQTWVSARVSIGKHTHLSYGSTIGHDTSIGMFCSIMPSACIGGDVTIGEGSLIGANATVLQGVKIGTGVIVGAGAVVIADVEPDQTVAGVPARPTTKD